MKTPPTPWLETQARVTACKYLFSRMNTLSLGVAADRNQFLISFTYYAHAKSYSGQFTSPTYLEQDSRFFISYNPLDPQENSKSASPSPTGTRAPIFAIGVAGSVVPIAPLPRIPTRLQLTHSRSANHPTE